MKVTTGVAIIFTFSVIPASAQYYQQYQYQYPATQQGCFSWFGCVQPAPSRLPRLEHPTRTHRKEHVRHRGNDREYSRNNHREHRRENDHKVTVAPTVGRVHIARPVKARGESNTWHGKSRDDARDWITKQANDFCEKFPDDKACHRAERPEQKKEEEKKE